MANVLVIDDEPSLVELLSLWLELHEFEVLTAEDGEAGLESLHAHGDEVDIILLDMMMPRMDGIAFLSTLREQRYTQPVVVLSAREINPALAECGVVAQFRKPLNESDRLELIKVLQRLKAPDA